jgi:2-polyprenyl-3-methyl-5-hydroxy-6-metoxy-1,4-benzoquinol methylase
MGNNEIKDFFDGIAPQWDAHENTSDERILSLLQRIGIKKGDAVLDVACGTGRITSLLHDLSGADVLGVDISDQMIAIAKKKYEGKPWAHFECGDFCAINGEKKYDVVVVYNAYPHFLKPEELNEAFTHCLKQGGLFAIAHSMGREQLSLHHEGVPSSVSRNLDKASTEAARFSKHFQILSAEDDETHYLIVGKRK